MIKTGGYSTKIIEGKDSQQLGVHIRFGLLGKKQTASRLLAAIHRKLIGSQRDKEYLLRLEDVCFTASSGKHTLLYAAQDYYGSMFRLYQMEEQLNDDFVRTNKATITNIEHVISMHTDLGSGIRIYPDTGHQHTVIRTRIEASKQELKGEQWHI